MNMTSLVAQWQIHLPVQETWVQSIGQEDLLEKGMAASSIVAWGIPWTEEPGGLQFMGLQRVGHDLVTEHKSMINEYTREVFKDET